MIVAIPNTTDRTHDLTPPIEKNKEAVQNMPTAGGANKMLAFFMKEELIPHIDKQYNTNDYRMLEG
ncbi:MAG: putative alpha/beta superfamily hydrolase [Polaribacter sp.]|jgi:predicted alpha/beta superfamily hydrolase